MRCFCIALVVAIVASWAARARASIPRRPILGNSSPLDNLLSAYKDRHKDAITNPSSGARFVVVDEVGGGTLGNSFPGIVSAFFVALMTNRTLFVTTDLAMRYLDHGDIDFRFQEQV